MGIQNVSGRVIIFILLLGVSTITYFIANQDRYVPNDQLYVEYTEQQLIDMQLDYSLDELNDHTLDEVFGQGNLLDAEQLVVNGDFSDGTTGWSSISIGTPIVNDGIISFTATAVGRLQKAQVVLNNTKYYMASRVKTDSNQIVMRLFNNNLATFSGSGQFEFKSNFETTTTIRIYPQIRDLRTSGWTQIDVDYIYLFNISTLIANKQYSPMFDTTFDLMTDANIKTQMDAWVQNPQYWLDFDALGWYPSQVKMEEYYQMYLDILDGERVVDLALGTIDSNGKDYYHLSVSDYEDLGNNGVVDFKYLFSENGPLLSVSKTLKVVKNFIETGIESFGNFIDGYLKLMQEIKDFIIWWK